MLVLCGLLVVVALGTLTVTGFIIPWLLVGLVAAVIDLRLDRSEDHSIVNRRVGRFVCVTLLGVISIFTTREHLGGTFFGKDLYFNLVDFKFGKRKTWSELS